jgi:hypothetical protein
MLFSVIFTPPPNPLFLLWFPLLDLVLLQTVIKVYLSYRIIIFNFAVGFLLGPYPTIYFIDSYMIEVVNMRLNSLSLFMVLVILLVSPCAIPCPIDHYYLRFTGRQSVWFYLTRSLQLPLIIYLVIPYQTLLSSLLSSFPHRSIALYFYAIATQPFSSLFSRTRTLLRNFPEHIDVHRFLLLKQHLFSRARTEQSTLSVRFILPLFILLLLFLLLLVIFMIFLFSISPNPIFFSMHSIGIFGFPRRISDYPVLFSRFHWLNAFGLVGVALPMFFLLSPFLFLATIVDMSLRVIQWMFMLCFTNPIAEPFHNVFLMILDCWWII